MARHRRERARDYPRTARLNELVREIVADALEREDDDRLELVTVVSVQVEADLRHATIWVSSLGDRDDEDTLEALGEARVRLQGAIARQARVKRVPELAFKMDDVTRYAARIEELLQQLKRDEERSDEP